MPPEITENLTDVIDATRPASSSPSLGPPAVTAMCIDDNLPRSSSGTESWTSPGGHMCELGTAGS
ncbi:MAG TPA: hypothetical protein VMO52_03340 [Acidimicrobiia bacterium]|nr:hypothetical protein [Acidimicrobiia bacterium]